MAISKDTQGNWVVPFSTSDTNLSTKDKYIDANILVKAPTVITPSTDYYTGTNTGFGAIGPGYIASTKYIIAGTAGAVSGGRLSVTADYTGTPTVTSSITGSETSYSSIETTQPTDGLYFTIGASSSVLNGSTTVARADASYSITKNGWITTAGAKLAGTSQNANVTIKAGSATIKYIKVVDASLSGVAATINPTMGGAWNSTTSKYVVSASNSGSATVNVTEGGFIPGSTSASATVTGSDTFEIAQAVLGVNVTGGSATIGTLTYTWNSSSSNYTVTSASTAVIGSAQAKTTTAGYAHTSTVSNSVNVNGSASVSTTLAKTNITTTVSGTAKVTPSLSKVATPSGDTWTDGSDGNATTTKPTSGVYVAMQSAAAANTVTAIISSATAGYSNGTNYGKTEGTASVGANASSVTYVKVKTGSAKVNVNQVISVTQGTLSISGTTVTIPVSGSKSISATVSTAGWITSVTPETVDASGNVTLTLYNGETA